MANLEIPPAEQSVSKIIALQHQIAEEHTPQGTTIGKIISPPPNIKIAWNNIILTKERIYIDEYLLTGHQRKITGKITTETDCAGHHVHSHNINSSYEGDWILIDTLKVGDLVEVTPMKGDQLFIVKCKLIYLGNGDGYAKANR